jgi:predicted transcriptional regulator
MKKIPSLGEQEMDLLKYIGEHAPVSVREAAAHFEKEKGLARTTILTVMERLRKKGFVSRAKTDGVFKYSQKLRTGDVLTHKVSDFIERTLGGSAAPLINYFMDSKSLNDDEIRQLKALAAKLEKGSGS